MGRGFFITGPPGSGKTTLKRRPDVEQLPITAGTREAVRARLLERLRGELGG